MTPRCPMCDAYLWPSITRSHRCHPQWEVQSVGEGTSRAGDYLNTVVYAVDEDDAATEAVETDWSDSGCGWDPEDPVRVKVRREGTEDWTERVVSGEPTIEWSASEPDPGDQTP